METSQERRKHPRYNLVDSAIAVCDNHPGHIQNISLGGLAFTYLDLGMSVTSEGVSVDIMDGENDFFLTGISCQTLDDSVVLSENPINMTTMTKRSVSFIELTYAQKLKLELYIEQHSICEVCLSNEIPSQNARFAIVRQVSANSELRNRSSFKNDTTVLRIHWS